MKNGWLIVTMIVVGAGAAAATIQFFSTAVPVQVALVRRGAMDAYVDERGKTRLAHTYDIAMPFSGRLEPIALAEGQRVEQGQIVAQVVGSDLDNEVAEAQAVVDRLQAAIREQKDLSVEQSVREQALELVQSTMHAVAAAEARIAAAAKRVEYDDWQRNLTSELFRKNAKTEEDVELAKLRLVESQVGYRQDELVWKASRALLAAIQLLPTAIDQYIARKGLAAAVLEKQKAEAEARLRQILQRRQRGVMRSPVGGVVLEKHVDDEQFVPAGTVLLRIGRLSDLEVEADFLTQDATRIAPKAAAIVYGLTTGSQTDRQLAGVVDRVYPQAFTKISSLGVEQQRVKVVVRLADEAVAQLRELAVGLDYRVRVRVITDRRSNALRMPRSALFRSPRGQWQVFAVERGRARLRRVRVGVINDRRVEILDGLQENEPVILAPENDLEDGIRVEPVVAEDGVG